jgi:RND family efflux transporter MFP subunit
MRTTYMPALAAMAFAAGCGAEEPGRVDRTAGPVAVAVSEAVSTGASILTPARVRAAESATLATRTSGTIRSVTIDVGSRVLEGDLLVRLDGSSVDAGVRRAEASANLARKYHERILALEADGAATGQELDEAIARLSMAEAGLEEARAERSYVELRAPFAGIVTARLVDPGDLAVPGKPVLILSGLHGLEIEADLPGNVRVREGDAVTISDRETGRVWPATATRVVPVLDAASHRFRVEATFDDARSDLPVPGRVVTLEVASPDETSLWIPSDAVLSRGQLRGVYTADDGLLRLRWLRLGAQRAGATEVLAGLPAGALVVRRPGAELSDGVPVETASVESWTLEGAL